MCACGVCAQAAISTLKAHAGKAGKPFWDRPDVVEAFANTGDTGTAYALGRDDFVTLKKHK